MCLFHEYVVPGDLFGLMSLKRGLYSAIIPPNALPLLSKEKKLSITKE